MTEPAWLSRRVVDAIHFDLLRTFGGAHGLRDGGAIESALARPRNKLACESPDIHDLAAAYTFGLAKNHGYADGNKRVALAVGGTFLHVNGVDFIVDEEQVVVVIHALCEDEIDEAALANWLRENSAPR